MGGGGVCEGHQCSVDFNHLTITDILLRIEGVSYKISHITSIRISLLSAPQLQHLPFGQGNRIAFFSFVRMHKMPTNI